MFAGFIKGLPLGRYVGYENGRVLPLKWSQPSGSQSKEDEFCSLMHPSHSMIT